MASEIIFQDTISFHVGLLDDRSAGHSVHFFDHLASQELGKDAIVTASSFSRLLLVSCLSELSVWIRADDGTNR